MEEMCDGLLHARENFMLYGILHLCTFKVYGEFMKLSCKTGLFRLLNSLSTEASGSLHRANSFTSSASHFFYESYTV